MILTGSGAKEAISLILVGSLLAVSCDQRTTPEEGKKENTALEGAILETAPKLITENQRKLR